MAYDLEGFIDGKHGVTKALKLWITDRATGRCEACPFAAGMLVATGGASADADAKAAQDEQEAKITAERQAILDRVKAQAEAGNGTLAGAVAAGINSLSA